MTTLLMPVKYMVLGVKRFPFDFDEKKKKKIFISLVVHEVISRRQAWQDSFFFKKKNQCLLPSFFISNINGVASVSCLSSNKGAVSDTSPALQ